MKIRMLGREYESSGMECMECAALKKKLDRVQRVWQEWEDSALAYADFREQMAAALEGRG